MLGVGGGDEQLAQRGLHQVLHLLTHINRLVHHALQRVRAASWQQGDGVRSNRHMALRRAACAVAGLQRQGPQLQSGPVAVHTRYFAGQHIGAADEIRHKAGLRPVMQLARATLLGNGCVVHHHHGV